MRPCTSTFPIDSSRNIRFRCTDASASVQGEVYRARDTKLGRDVAIKVLPDAFAQNADRLRRFQREAKVLASLNHPNIASIYGLEQSESTHYLVLELVSGETLAARIARGPIPIEEALDIAAKISEALEEAHERGVVHRDLKPANIMLTPDGKVKVLDFGLAKAFGSDVSATATDSSQSPTITRDATRAGTVMGTAAYMSPEQASGRSVDGRTDVWSFGCIVYEMLTGRRVFGGDSATETLASVMRDQPDWNVLSSTTPTSLRRLLLRALAKDREERLRHLGDARLEIREALAVPASDVPGSAQRPPLRILPYALTAFAAALLAAVTVWRAIGFSPDNTPSLLRFSVSLPSGQQFMTRRGFPHLAVSRDGSRFAYIAEFDGTSRLYLRRADQFEATEVPESETAHSPFFSPDGQWVGFFDSRGRLRKAPVDGGAPQPITERTVRVNSPGASWSQDDRIVFSSDRALMEVSAAGGTPETLAVPKGSPSGWYGWPQHLPKSDDMLFTIRGQTPSGRIVR